LELAGSPAKFLQGHNVFGSDDLASLGAAMIELVCWSLSLELVDHELTAIRFGQYKLQRVDFNYRFPTGSRSNVLAWIDTAAAVGTLVQRGRGKLRESGTVIWGEVSRYWKLKAYSKGEEIEARHHELPEGLPMRSRLAEWSHAKLRVELELRARQLRKLGLNQASSWRVETPKNLFIDYVAKLRLGEPVMLNANDVKSLPYRLRQTYTNWLRCENLMQRMSKPTYYRHRRELLEHGINIAVFPPKEASATIMLNERMAKPCVEVPSWAMGTQLCWDQELNDRALADRRESVMLRRRSSVTRIEAVTAPIAVYSAGAAQCDDFRPDNSLFVLKNPFEAAA
jgi:II/X family phage/plasmid replication protein